MSVLPAPRPLGWSGAHAPAVHAWLREAVWIAPLLVTYLLICLLGQPGLEAVRDEPDLLGAAARMADGHILPNGEITDPRAYLWHGPGLVGLLAPLVAFDLPLTTIRFLGPVLLGCAVLVFHRLLRVRLAPRPALAFTYALGLYVPFFAVLPQIHKEPLAILLVVSGMLALTRGLGGGRPLSLAGAGLALGGLAMVRLEYGWVALLLLAVALATWAVRRHSATARRLVAVTAVAVAACVPWLAYTYGETGQALYWGSSSGLSLFWMSPTLPGQTGQWHSPDKVAKRPELTAFRPMFRRVHRMGPQAGDRWLRDRAIENIRARPATYLRNVAANTTRLLFAVPMRPRLSAFGIGIFVVCNGLLLLAGSWAAAVLWRRRRSLAPEVAPLAIFAGLALAIHLPPSASPRMLLPIVPVLVWLVAQAAWARRAAPTS